MIPNLVNVLLGLILLYIAVLQPALTGDRPALLLGFAALIFAAAYLARRSDHHPWQNNSNMLLAIILAAVGILRLQHLPLALFWSQFSIGMIVAVLALWAVLYRPTSQRPTGE
jgi:uncharacterized membrane protein HdeD (DUF308 family)